MTSSLSIMEVLFWIHICCSDTGTTDMGDTLYALLSVPCFKQGVIIFQDYSIKMKLPAA